MRKLFISLILVGLLTLALAVPAFAAHENTPGGSTQCDGLERALEASNASGHALDGVDTHGCSLN